MRVYPLLPQNCQHPRFLFGRCSLCGLNRQKTRPTDGLHIKGFARPNEERRARLVQRIHAKTFELREQGYSVKEIAFKLKQGVDIVEACLHDRDNVKRRIETYNEQLRSYSPQALKVLRDVLFSSDPRDRKQQREVALWVLEMTKVVGKESPVNIFVNAPGAQAVILNHEEIEAARSVAALMGAQKQLPEAPKPEIIDAEVVATTEEKSVGGATSSTDPPSV